MEFPIDPNDYYSLLAAVHRLGRDLEPALRFELAGLLAPRAPSCLGRVADAARGRKLHDGFARDMLPMLIEACSEAIDAGMETRGDCYEAGYSDGGVDWECREITVPNEIATQLIPIRRTLRDIVALLDRVDDLMAAQQAIPDMRR